MTDRTCVSREFAAIGTSWRLDFYGLPADDTGAHVQAVRDRIATFDQDYSRFRDDSLVAGMSRAAGVFELPDDAAAMLGIYRKLYELTDGAVTPLVGGLLADAGYDAGYSLKEGTLERPPAWDAVMRWDEAAGTLITTRPVRLDFGAAGKGYLVDLACELLEARGVSGFTVDAGGDMRHHHAGEPLRIGLEHPDDATRVIGVATLAGGALCGSADNRRRWGRFHHIMDPRTLSSSYGMRATWVAAESGLVADALATALFFVPPATLAPHFTFEAVTVAANGTVTKTAGFPGELFA